MKFKKGESGNKNGRPKGTPNKATAEIKDMLRAALEGVGGVEYFKAQARANPAPFMSLLGKTIPADINAKLTGDVHVTIKQISPIGKSDAD